MSRKKLTLGEKIALAASGNQEDEFPEDTEYGDTSAKVTELDEDHDKVRPVARSSLRTKNVKLLDEYDSRYSGEKVSRKILANGAGIESDDDEEDNNEIGDDSDEEQLSGSDEDIISSVDEEDHDSTVEGDADDGEDEESGDSEGDKDDDNVESEQDDSDPEESGAQSEMQTLSLRDKQAEIQKGKATLNQLRIWDSLLEVRIRLQKMLLDCNRLPKTVMYEELISDLTSNDAASAAKLSNVINKSEQATKTLIHELIRLQKIMSEKNEETKKALLKKVDPSKEVNDNLMNEEITSESEEEDNSNKNPSFSPERKRRMDSGTISEDAKKMKLEGFQLSAETSFSSFIPYRNQTIQKWNDKTQFAGGKFNRKTASQQISTLRQIEQILSNKERLVKRTQVKRSTYSVIGDEPSSTVLEEESNSVDQEPDPEVFDDDDFYHQLLRELIERKTSNVNDPLQLSHHWLELQKLRTKLKRKIDTKASKGRKIRYDVQAKLVNFMAPQDKCNMSNAAVKELFGSLFGQTKQ